MVTKPEICTSCYIKPIKPLTEWHINGWSNIWLCNHCYPIAEKSEALWRITGDRECLPNWWRGIFG